MAVPLSCVCAFLCVICMSTVQARPSTYGLDASDPDNWPYFFWRPQDASQGLGFLPAKRAVSKRSSPFSPIGFFPEENSMATRSYPMISQRDRWSFWNNLPNHKDEIGFFPSKRSGFFPSDDDDSYLSPLFRSFQPVKHPKRMQCNLTKSVWGLYCCELPLGESQCDCQGPYGRTFNC